MAAQPASNSDYDWSAFDPESYVAHYYADPHPDDDEVVRLTARALKSMSPGGGAVDVGTGPNLFPLLAAMPRAGQMTAWEYSETNVAWLRTELQGAALREPWPHFWKLVREGYAPERLEDDPTSALRLRANVVQGSIFDLPKARWDAATMFFCAESITEQQEEFERACAAFARAVRPGGVLAAAFLAGSRGYVVAETAFPAVAINEASLVAAFEPHAARIDITPIGIVEEEIRSGYSGMYFLSARAR